MSNLANTKFDASSANDITFGTPKHTDYYAEGVASVSRPQNSRKTRATSAFVQGVEVQDFTDYSLGLLKILSGEPDNALMISTYGQHEEEHIVSPWTPSFSDNQDVDCNVFSIFGNRKKLTYPLMTDGHAQQIDEHGQPVDVIEPLTIRTAASLVSLYFPFEAHMVWGSVEEGNLTHFRAADEVVNVYDRKRIPYPAFLDTSTRATFEEYEYFKLDFTELPPWVDTSYSETIRMKTTGPITSAVNLIEYDGGYVLEHERSATSGFVFESTYGTDSIAFGGMTY